MCMNNVSLGQLFSNEDLHTGLETETVGLVKICITTFSLCFVTTNILMDSEQF